MDYKVLSMEHVGEMAELLASRHREERSVFPFLDPYFEKVAHTRTIIEALLRQEMAIAIGAYNENKLVAFIASYVKIDHVFGRCAWVPYEGLACEKGVSVEIYRRLYAHIADEWIDKGCLKHYVIVPSARAQVVDAWLHLSFAYEQVYGIKPFDKKLTSVGTSFTTRMANERDKMHLSSVSSLIMAYQSTSPTYAVALPEMYKVIEEGYQGLVSDDDARVLLAFDGKELAGFTCGFLEKDNTSNMLLPYKGMELGVQATYGMYQGKGVGQALVNALFNLSMDEGYENSLTDWRISNLTSSVFWPKCGYEVVAYRMVRNIDPRILWASKR